MKKKVEVIRDLDEIKKELNEVKDKLNNLVNQPIWSDLVHDELDEVIKILQSISKLSRKTVSVQRDIMVNNSPNLQK